MGKDQPGWQVRVLDWRLDSWEKQDFSAWCAHHYQQTVRDRKSEMPHRHWHAPRSSRRKTTIKKYYLQKALLILLWSCNAIKHLMLINRVIFFHLFWWMVKLPSTTVSAEMRFVSNLCGAGHDMQSFGNPDPAARSHGRHRAERALSGSWTYSLLTLILAKFSGSTAEDFSPHHTGVQSWESQSGNWAQLWLRALFFQPTN